MQLDGIDTSHHQTLTGQPLPPLEFAITKASQGVSFKDPECAQLLARFRTDNARRVGCYHFVDPVGTAQQQFNNFVSVCAANGPLDFVMIDWEREPNSGVFPPLQTVLDFEALCQAKWARVFVYSAPWVTGFSTWLARPNRSPLWYPNYSSGGDATAKRLGAVVRQYTSSLQLPAFTGFVDANTILDQAAWDAIFNIEPSPKPQPPSPTPPILLEDDMPIVTLYRSATRQLLTIEDGAGTQIVKGLGFDDGIKDDWTATIIAHGPDGKNWPVNQVGNPTGSPAVGGCSEATIDYWVKAAEKPDITVNVDGKGSTYTFTGTATPS